MMTVVIVETSHINKLVHDMINFILIFYYDYWTDKNKFYIFVDVNQA